jgi:hypothetical protein
MYTRAEKGGDPLPVSTVCENSTLLDYQVTRPRAISGSYPVHILMVLV